MTVVSGRHGRLRHGPHTAAFKYDLLTAMGAHACAADKHMQRTILRLMTLITSRYDWQRDALTTGQREIAALWSVDERTVKREIARLRERGWLVLRHPAARGRVACHGLGIDVILAATRPHWDAVGPDFVARLTGPAPETSAPSAVDNIIPFPAATEGPWAEICRRFHSIDPATHLAWIAPLRFDEINDGQLTLRAPSRFHASFVRTHHAAALLVHARGVLAATSVEIAGP